MASVTDHGAADDPRSGATSLADWATAVAAALDDDDTTVDTRIATSSAADQSYADGVAAAAQSAAEATAAGALASHEADSTNVHGIADTSALVTTARQIVSGAGLTGGGTLAADRTLAVGAGTGITVNADDVAVDTSVIAPLASPVFTGNPQAPTPPAGDADTSIATTAWAAERATVGNLLSANQASVETDTTGFTATNSTLARASGGERGTYCLEITATAASAGAYLYGNASGGSMPVVAGTPYTFRARVKAASITRVVYVKVFWWQSNGTSAASTASHTSAGTTLSTSWQTADITAVAPSNAAYASLMIYGASTASSEVYLVDALGFWAGAGGDWAMPGTPITNLGRRVTHPNTDDVLVENWDAGLVRWQTVHYDSGWRQVSSWNAAGVVTGEAIGAGFAPRSGVAGRYRIRRVNSMVTVQITQIKATVAAPSTAMFGPLTGFRASSEVPFAVTFGMSPAPFSGAHGLVVTSIGIARGGSQHFGSTTIAEWSTATINYLTDDPIPTSLPGTLVSAAPA